MVSHPYYVFTFDHELSVGIGTYYTLQGGGFPTRLPRACIATLASLQRYVYEFTGCKSRLGMKKPRALSYLGLGLSFRYYRFYVRYW